MFNSSAMMRIFCVLVAITTVTADTLESDVSVDDTSNQLPEGEEIAVAGGNDSNDSDAQLSSLRLEVQALKEQNAEVENVKKSLEDKISTLESETKTEKAKIAESASQREREVTNLSMEKQKLEEQVSKLESDVKSAISAKEDTITELNQLKSDMEISRSANEETELELKQLKIDLESIVLSKDNAVAELAQQKKDMESTSSTQQTMEEEIKQLKEDLLSATWTKDNIEVQLSQCSEASAAAEETYALSQKAHADAMAAVDKNLAEQIEISSTLKQAAEERESAAVANAEQLNNACEEKMEQSSVQLQELKAKLADLETQLSGHDELKTRLAVLEAPRDLAGIMKDVTNLTARSSRSGLISGSHVVTRSTRSMHEAVASTSSRVLGMVDESMPHVVSQVYEAVHTSKALSKKLGGTILNVTASVATEAKVKATPLYDTHLKHHVEKAKATTVTKTADFYEQQLKVYVDKASEVASPHVTSLANVAAIHLSKAKASSETVLETSKGETSRMMTLVKAQFAHLTNAGSRHLAYLMQQFETGQTLAIEFVSSKHVSEEDACVIVDATLIVCALLLALLLFKPVLLLVRAVGKLIFECIASVFRILFWVVHLKVSTIMFAVRTVVFLLLLPFRILFSPFTFVFSLIKRKKAPKRVQQVPRDGSSSKTTKQPTQKKPTQKHTSTKKKRP